MNKIKVAHPVVEPTGRDDADDLDYIRESHHRYPDIDAHPVTPPSSTATPR